MPPTHTHICLLSQSSASQSYFFFLAVLLGMWDLGSSTMGRTCAPGNGRVESKPLDPLFLTGTLLVL